MQNAFLIAAYLLTLISLLSYRLRKHQAKDFFTLISWLRSMRFCVDLKASAPSEDASFTLTLMRKSRQMGIHSRQALSEFYFLVMTAQQEATRQSYILRLYVSRTIMLSILACLGRLIYFYFFAEEALLAWLEVILASLALLVNILSFDLLKKMQPLHWVGDGILTETAKDWLKDRLFFRGQIPGKWGEEMHHLRSREMRLGLSLKADKKALLDLFIKEKEAILIDEQKKLADKLVLFELIAQSLPVVLLGLGPFLQALG